jgi:bifunctional DNA-binding transcriptional regulator/antitoxin component of YhaV-PrlF toxin-antitoxin module
MNIIEVQQDIDGEFYIEIPEDIIDSLGWNVEDELEWVINQDNTITLRKKEEEK